MDSNQENQGDNSTGANRQAIFTPQPEQPEVVPGTGIPTQPSVDLSHPYFSNHPTQTFNTEAGDIILNTGTPKPKQNKRPFIIGGIIFAVIAVVLVVVLLLVLPSLNSKSKLLSVLESNIHNIEDLEELFYDGARDNIMAYKILTPGAYKKINSGMNDINAIRAQLESAKTDGMTNDMEDKIVFIKKQLNELGSSYQETVTTYNELYLAYQDNNDQTLSELASSDNKTIASVANRIVDFLDTRNYWQQVISDNCSNTEAQSCKEAEVYYNENQATFEANTSIARSLSTAYIPQPYTKEKMLYPQLQDLISELKNV